MSRPDSAVPNNMAAAQLLSAFSMNQRPSYDPQQQRQQQNEWDERNLQQQRSECSGLRTHNWGETDMPGPPPTGHQQAHQHQQMGYPGDDDGQAGMHSMQLPFGYAFDIPDEELLNQPPPPPPPGNGALLSDTETRMLSSFFDSVQTGDLTGNTWGEGLAINPNDWSLNNQLLDISQYKFFGSTVMNEGSILNGGPHIDDGTNGHRANSNGHGVTVDAIQSMSTANHLQNSLSQAHDLASMIAPASSLEDAHEIYEAAATLYQNSQNAASIPISMGPQQQQQQRIPPMYPSSNHHGHDQQHHHHSSLHGSSFLDRANRPVCRSSSVSLEWGSDSGFANGNYVAPANDSSRFLQQRQQAVVGSWFSINTASGATTRVPSPTATTTTTQTVAVTPTSPKRTRTGNGEAETRATTPLPATKRRKSTHTRDHRSPTSPSSQQLTTATTITTTSDELQPQSQPQSQLPSTTITTTTTKPRRRHPTKEPRRNLTDAQKRENHIVSEQRRRTQIKVGFSELSEIVPGLKGGGFSKSAVLSMTCEFLKALEEGNQRLEGQLKGLVCADSEEEKTG